MPNNRRLRRHLKYGEKPQDYEHRVEIAIEALFHATNGIQVIIAFLRQQQSPDWRNTQSLKQAASNFQDSIWWLGKRDAIKRL